MFPAPSKLPAPSELQSLMRHDSTVARASRVLADDALRARTQILAIPKLVAGQRRSTLLRIVWPFLLALAVLMAATGLSIEVLMAVRAFELGENLYVKAQKSASLELLSYAQGGANQTLQAHDEAMDKLLSFQVARYAMRQSPPDDARAKLEFSAIGIADLEIDKALWANRWFGRSERFGRIFDIWEQADTHLARFPPLRQSLIDAHRSQQPDLLAALGIQIKSIDDEITPLSRQFTAELAETSRLVYFALLSGGFILTLTLGLCVVLRTRIIWQDYARSQRTLAAERRQAQVTLASIADAVVSTDHEGRIQYMNQAARVLSGYEGPIDAHPPISEVLKVLDKAGTVVHPTEEVLHRRGEGPVISSSSKHVVVRQDQSRVAVSWVASSTASEEGTTGAVIVIRDVTHEHRMMDKLTWLATHDPLTRLPNRREFESRLESALLALQTDPTRDTQHVVMLLDLDQFKLVNDTSGHPAGDELLKLVSAAARGQMRESDTLARMGGDEFALLLQDCPQDIGEARAQQLCEAIRAVEMTWNGQRIAKVSASIGLVHVRRESGLDSAALLSAADVACYLAKERGRDQVAIYRDNALFGERVTDMAWPQRIHAALAENRFVLYQQKILGLQPHTLRSQRCELLLRLHDESGRLVPPNEFLPAAERYGMMPLIDRWVVDNALKIIAESKPRGPEYSYAINLSGSALGNQEFLDDVHAMFARHGVAYERICFEITETQAVQDLPAAAKFIANLRLHGATFALDDFGSGMSSMAYLKQLPVDVLKIDGKLVKDIGRDPMNRAIVEMIAHLAQTLGLKTVGEFAGDDATIDILRTVGVDFAQGFGVEKPKPFDDLSPLTPLANPIRSPAIAS